jgi:hypothetical protein
MAALTRQRIHTLRRLLNDAHSHVLDAAQAHHDAGDTMSETRLNALAWQLAAELDYLERLLPDTPPALPVPVRSH